MDINSNFFFSSTKLYVHTSIAFFSSLDPARPNFNNAGAGSGIHRNDAAHVQVIHTNGGNLGLLRVAGDSDFYPNGGRNQPDCLTAFCSHSRAWELFAESIRNPRGFRAGPSIFMGGRTLSTR